MSNPFDVFAADFRAAVPTVDNNETIVRPKDISNNNIGNCTKSLAVPFTHTTSLSTTSLSESPLNISPSPIKNVTNHNVPSNHQINIDEYNVSHTAANYDSHSPHTTKIDLGSVTIENSPLMLNDPQPICDSSTKLPSPNLSKARINLSNDSHHLFGLPSMNNYGAHSSDTTVNILPESSVSSTNNISSSGATCVTNSKTSSNELPSFVPSDIHVPPPRRQDTPLQFSLSGSFQQAANIKPTSDIPALALDKVKEVVPSQPTAHISAPFSTFDPVAVLPNDATSPTDLWDKKYNTSTNKPSEILPVSQSSNNEVDDPFGIFDSTSLSSPDTSNIPVNSDDCLTTSEIDDPWSEFSFGASSATFDSSKSASSSSTSRPEIHSKKNNNLGIGLDNSLIDGENIMTPVSLSVKSPRKDNDLPTGGEWYDARIFTPTLGVMFFKPAELMDSLFLQTDRVLVDSLKDRPVVAFIVEGSSARSAGVELGHVLLKVNGTDVKNPKEASRLIKEGPRPLPLLFYVPDTSVVVSEGDHMVKYDTRDTGAPNSAKDWKSKYVVIGGIISQPWMMNMYRSKSEYDIAVIETQARRPVSVKVKQFSLQGARIQNDWQGPQMVKYKNKLHPWKYIVVLPVSRNPIKISSHNLGQLKPVHEGIRRVLMAQQRHASTASSSLQYRSGDSYARSTRVPNNGGVSAYEGSGGICSARRRHEY